MDIIKRVKCLCTSGKYRGSIRAVTLQIAPAVGRIDTRNYNAGNDAIVGELFDRSISGWSICSASMLYERGEDFRLVLLLRETTDKSSNISDEVIQVISNLPRRY